MKLKSIVFVSLLLVTLNTAAISGHDSQIQTNSIYQSCGHYLYEQDNIVESEAFKAADQEQQTKMLQNEFFQRRRNCYAWETGKIAATFTLMAAIGYTGYYAYGELYPNPNANANAVVNAPNVNINIGAGLGGTLMVYQFFGSVIADLTRVIQSKVEVAKSLIANLILPHENDLLEKYELEYLAKKRFLSNQLQEVLEQNFLEARLSKSTMGDGMGGSRKSKVSPIDFARDVLSLPTEKVEVVYDKKEFDKYLGTFEKEVIDALKLVGAEHSAASTGETVKRTALMLVGPPGVGKTKAAKAVADALNAPFRSIKIGGKTLAEIEGDESNPGLLLEALMSARNRSGKNGKNSVIFFDELDRALGMSERGSNYGSGRKGKMSYGDVSAAIIPFLLELFESETQTFYSPYLRMDVDISDILFIAAGNVDWDAMLKDAETKDKALKDRFEFVPFKGYSPEFKLKVTKTDLFDEILVAYKKSKTSLNADDFTSEDWESIEKMVLGDKEPGFREVIRQLKKFVARKALCKYTGECQIGVFDENEVATCKKAYGPIVGAAKIPSSLTASTMHATFQPVAKLPTAHSNASVCIHP